MKRILIGGAFFWMFLMLWNIGFAAERNLPWIDIISRAEWWADESIRLLTRSKAEIAAEKKVAEQERLANLKKTNPTAYQAELKKIEAAQVTANKNAKISSDRNAYMKKNYPNDRTFDYSNDMMGEYYLIYQDQIKKNKTKLIVHHTAMAYDTNRTESEIKSALQRIYKYHTIDRDFGDIWYNFLIDHLGNIYEGRAGGEGAVGMQVAYNNISSVGISLMGNFEEIAPTQAQINALTDLLTALAKRYEIDPTAKETYHQPSSTYPYMTHKELYTIVGHWDIAPTACPGKYMKELLPLIRGEVTRRLNGQERSEVSIDGHIIKGENSQTIPEVSQTEKPSNPSSNLTSSTFWGRLLELKNTRAEILQKALRIRKDLYTGTIPNATNTINKLNYTYTIDEVKDIIHKDISVLLYELTTKYTTFTIQCEEMCAFVIDGEEYLWPNAHISFSSEEMYISRDGSSNSFSALEIKVTSENEVVEITNYDRKSYAGIPRNTFKGSLIFKNDNYKTLKGETKNDRVVINTLPFMEYMKGVIETNDTEHIEKNKVMAMISKNYALFYLEKKNIHPSVPENASFSAIDSPDMFQKYVGAGAEKTLKKRYQALEETKNQVVLYDSILPILPYFSCSAGFTLSAREKYGWIDTPYLQSVFDFSSCGEFQGHGVGLAWKGAEFLAQKGMNYQEILRYFYEGIDIKNIE